MGILKGLNRTHRRTSMGPLEGPHKREKVKQYPTRDFTVSEIKSSYLVPSALIQRLITSKRKIVEDF
jgi:hypothetical protein